MNRVHLGVSFSPSISLCISHSIIDFFQCLANNWNFKDFEKMEREIFDAFDEKKTGHLRRHDLPIFQTSWFFTKYLLYQSRLFVGINRNFQTPILIPRVWGFPGFFQLSPKPTVLKCFKTKNLFQQNLNRYWRIRSKVNASTYVFSTRRWVIIVARTRRKKKRRK